MTTQTLERAVSVAPQTTDAIVQLSDVTKLIAARAVRTVILGDISFVVPQHSLADVSHGRKEMS